MEHFPFVTLNSHLLTSIDEHDLDRIQVNRRARYLRQRSFENCRPDIHTHTHTHTHTIERTTLHRQTVVGNNSSEVFKEGSNDTPKYASNPDHHYRLSTDLHASPIQQAAPCWHRRHP